MKAFAAMCLVGFCLGAMGQDNRVVGGKKVDVEPVKKWLANPKGERPMPHWKQITVKKAIGTVGVRSKCSLEIDGEIKIVLLSNPKPETLKRLARIEYLKTYLPRETERLKQESHRIDRVDATTPTGVSGNADYVNAVMQRRYQVNLDAANLKHDEEILEALTKEASELEALAKEDSDIAMNTGTTYAGLEVWDCGVRAR